MIDVRPEEEPPFVDPADDKQPLTGAKRPTRAAYLVGVYLATNAISDACTIIDGPDCTFFKTEFIHGRHDINSTLLDVLGHHRIITAQTTPDNVATTHGDNVVQRLRDAGRVPGVNLVMVSAMPLVSIIGLQYDQMIRGLQSELSHLEMVEVPSLSLVGDWLEGYQEAMATLATLIEEPKEKPQKDHVSIIGYFMDRTEQDHLANVAELRRLIEAMDLTVDSVWLSGCPWDDLKAVRRSGTLITLPMGARAAKALAERTGAEILPVDTPMGLGRTVRFLQEIAQATGREQQAEAVIEKELSGLVRRLEWAIPQYFLGLNVAFSATPDLLPGMRDITTELGMEVVDMISPAARPSWFTPADVGGQDVGFDASFDLRNWFGTKRPQLLIGDTLQLEELRRMFATIEFGFPSYRDHAIFERPFLGFRGHASFVQRMITALANFSAARERRIHLESH